MKSKKAAPRSEASVVLDPSQAAFGIKQLAAYTGLSAWQCRMAIWQGRLVAKKVGKSLVVLRADADAFLSQLPAVSTNKSDWLARRQAVQS